MSIGSSGFSILNVWWKQNSPHCGWGCRHHRDFLCFVRSTFVTSTNSFFVPPKVIHLKLYKRMLILWQLFVYVLAYMFWPQKVWKAIFEVVLMLICIKNTVLVYKNIIQKFLRYSVSKLMFLGSFIIIKETSMKISD